MAVSPVIAAKKEVDIDAEKKLGQQAVAEVDPTLKFITDEKYVNRVKKIGEKLAAVAKKDKITATYGSAELADFDYVFKVVDDKDVNAMSLPGGYVYVNKGLLDKIESDDELAGVIAHEIAHIAHHHMVFLLKKEGQYNKILFAILAAAMIGKASGPDMQNVLYGARLFEIAKLNAYSQEAEDDADRTAIEYMIKANYNPVGLLTFMEKLARDQAYEAVDPGIFRTHPVTKNRANNIIAELKKRGITINRRAVSSGAIAIIRDTEVKGQKIAEVVVDNRVILRPANLPGSSSVERAKTITDTLNRQLDKNPEFRDVKLSHDGTGVYIKDVLIVNINDEDAELAGLTKEALALKVKEAIQAVFLSESLKLLY